MSESYDPNSLLTRLADDSEGRQLLTRERLEIMGIIVRQNKCITELEETLELIAGQSLDEWAADVAGAALAKVRSDE